MKIGHMNNTNELLSQGIAALKAGQKAKARSLLEQVVQQDERNEMAWLWLSGAVDTDDERYTCLQKVLAINPSSAVARRGIEALQRNSPRSDSKLAACRRGTNNGPSANETRRVFTTRLTQK